MLDPHLPTTNGISKSIRHKKAHGEPLNPTGYLKDETGRGGNNYQAPAGEKSSNYVVHWPVVNAFECYCLRPS